MGNVELGFGPVCVKYNSLVCKNWACDRET